MALLDGIRNLFSRPQVAAVEPLTASNAGGVLDKLVVDRTYLQDLNAQRRIKTARQHLGSTFDAHLSETPGAFTHAGKPIPRSVANSMMSEYTDELKRKVPITPEHLRNKLNSKMAEYDKRISNLHPAGEKALNDAIDAHNKIAKKAGVGVISVDQQLRMREDFKKGIDSRAYHDINPAALDNAAKDFTHAHATSHANPSARLESVFDGKDRARTGGLNRREINALKASAPEAAAVAAAPKETGFFRSFFSPLRDKSAEKAATVQRLTNSKPIVGVSIEAARIAETPKAVTALAEVAKTGPHPVNDPRLEQKPSPVKTAAEQLAEKQTARKLRQEAAREIKDQAKAARQELKAANKLKAKAWRNSTLGKTTRATTKSVKWVAGGVKSAVGTGMKVAGWGAVALAGAAIASNFLKPRGGDVHMGDEYDGLDPIMSQPMPQVLDFGPMQPQETLAGVPLVKDGPMGMKVLAQRGQGPAMMGPDVASPNVLAADGTSVIDGKHVQDLNNRAASALPPGIMPA